MKKSSGVSVSFTEVVAQAQGNTVSFQLKFKKEEKGRYAFFLLKPFLRPCHARSIPRRPHNF